MTGLVHGGQQPVSGSSIKLYAAGTSGNGSLATNLLTSAVYTDGNGFFSLTGKYACNSYTDQVYLVSTGGNPGLSGNVNNTGLALMAALGNCGDLLANAASRYVYINEITTAAAAWALAPFMTGPANLGRSSTNLTGLSNAFLDSNLLANTSTGQVATNSNGLKIESGKLIALADALASCVNTAGGTACNKLFAAATPSGGTAPTDTITAAVNIVRNPTNNVAAVFNTISATSPFNTTLTSAPNDWSMSVTMPLAAPSTAHPAAPTSLDIDATGDVWVAGYWGILNGLSPQGALLSSAGYGVGSLNESYGLTIDAIGYIWVSNEESSPHGFGSVSKFQSNGLASPGTVVAGNGGTNFYDNSLDYPVSLAANASGQFFIANYAGSSATEYNSSGTVVNSGLGATGAAFPTAMAADALGGGWLGNFSDYTVTHFNAAGTTVNTTCCNGANGLATDAAGNVWISNYVGSSVSAVSQANTTLVSQTTAGGVNYPAGISVDAGGTVWVANYGGKSISAYSSGTVAGNRPIGTALTPSNGMGLDAGLLDPYTVIPDASGNLWISNFGSNDVVLLMGLATPTQTPTFPTPTAP